MSFNLRLAAAVDSLKACRPKALSAVVLTTSLGFSASAGAAGWAYVPNCSWANPGHNKFVGNIADSVSSFTPLTYSARQMLKARLATGGIPNDVIRITRDGIESTTSPLNRYLSDITYMHFGASAKVCHTLDRSMWSLEAAELADVWCYASKCIAVPRVCGNPSLIQRVAWPEVPTGRLAHPRMLKASVFPAEHETVLVASGSAPDCSDPGSEQAACRVNKVPEPSAGLLVLVGMAAMSYARWRKLRRPAQGC